MSETSLETKHPITYRPTIIYILGSFFCFLFIGVPALLLPFYISKGITFWIIYFLLFFIGIVFPIYIWSAKISLNENGFAYNLFFKKTVVSWSEITKVTAVAGWSPVLYIYYSKNNGNAPLTSGNLYTAKSLVNFLEVLISKAPQAEIGLGVKEYLP